MPKDKTAMHEKIIPAAMKEFLEYGFEKASMRRIAASVGITAAGLYRHFESKEDMFSALVEPTVQEFFDMYRSAEQEVYMATEKVLSRFNEIWDSSGEPRWLLDYVYKHFDVFKLLICCSHGTRYENFLNDFVVFQENSSKAYYDFLRKNGINANIIPDKEIHLLVTNSINAIFETVVHDFTYEEAMHYADTLDDFLTYGWKKIFGI